MLPIEENKHLKEFLISGHFKTVIEFLEKETQLLEQTALKQLAKEANTGRDIYLEAVGTKKMIKLLQIKKDNYERQKEEILDKPE